MRFAIRAATLNDSNAVTELSNQLGYAMTISATMLSLEQIIEDRNAVVMVAETAGLTVGWIHGFRTTRVESGSFCEIGGLVVDQQYRRTGVGRLLVDAIKQWCIDQQLDELRVRCNVKRAEAHRFYEGLGFEESKEQKVFRTRIS